jgi:predicted  nucleic acid-binding Zn-ribbon protein
VNRATSDASPSVASSEQAIGQRETKLEQLNQQISASEAQLLDILRRIDAAKHEAELGEKKLIQLRDDCAKSLARSESLQSDIKDLNAHAEALQNAISAQEKLIKQLNDHAVESKRAVIQGEQKLSQLGQQISALESAIIMATRKCDATKQDLDALEKRLAILREEYAKAQAARDKSYADMKEFEAKAEALRKAITTYEALVKGLQSDISKRTGTEAVEPTKALEDLAQPALGFNFTGQSALSENSALNRFSEYLVSKGLKYPERVQLAFHTSLKASQINPLVVLAGVSGTGKSALPMAYAEALGINFVSLAVQPGWSGPQDLLGFYNYLERKYKATELARAMAQMSRFSHEDLPGLNIKSRKDEMLLVLLDEMNLARIEYYFSDFLSRLEQRRGRNLSDAQRRREVALHLDIGSLPANEAPRFILPDLNVLFVGTMNEDESTQSLSDKVVDRANVLRFGAPKDLHAPTTNLVAPTKTFLPRTNWEGWVKAFDGDALPEERKLLSEINAQLEKINRPFGHRVFRAILDYISNYPGAANNQERRAHALADQIEQKIIPKLRGLETEGDGEAPCLEYIAGKIGDLRDSELRDAFDRARGGHMFEWHGVKRS